LTGAVFMQVIECLVPHSQCSLRENPEFLQKFRLKNNSLKENFWLIFLFHICHYNLGMAFLYKNYYIASQNCVYFIRDNSQSLRQKRKRALWMRHLVFKWSLKSSLWYFSTWNYVSGREGHAYIFPVCLWLTPRQRFHVSAKTLYVLWWKRTFTSFRATKNTQLKNQTKYKKKYLISGICTGKISADICVENCASNTVY
jgi:hypothetical protein